MFAPLKEIRFTDLTASIEDAVPSALDDTARNAYRVFTRRTFLALREGTGARVSRIPKTLQETFDPDYQRRIARSDVVIATGKMSANLIAIEFTDPDLMEGILKACPELCKTTITRSSKSDFLWPRMDGWYPTSQTLPGIIWHADGDIVPVASRRLGQVGHLFRVPTPRPITITWALLERFAPLRDGFLEQTIAAKHGPPFHRDGSLNLSYWALLSSQRTQLRYAPDLKKFTIFDTKRQRMIELYPAEALGRLHEFLQQHVQEIGVDRLAQCLHPTFLKDLLEMVRILAPCRASLIRLDLADLLVRLVEPNLGSDITCEEICKAVMKFCAGHRMPPPGKRDLQQGIPSAMRQAFGVDLTHGIYRYNKRKGRNTERRGYSRLRIRTEFEDVSDDLDAQDAAKLSIIGSHAPGRT